jgi:hypothetical protein
MPKPHHEMYDDSDPPYPPNEWSNCTGCLPACARSDFGLNTIPVKKYQAMDAIAYLSSGQIILERIRLFPTI